jgi:hypothetical protein
LFKLVIDNFGVKYVEQEHVAHLIACIKEKYELIKDWTGDFYCKIKINLDYTARTHDISMPGYIKKLFLKYKHCVPAWPQHCPYAPAPKQYGTAAQSPLLVNISPRLSPEKIKEI